LASQEVLEHHQEATKINIKNVSDELKDLDAYRDFDETYLAENLLLFFNLLESIVHRHLIINRIHENDEQLVKFLGDLFSCLIQNGLLFSPSQ
jgi:hypothetical protein